MKRIVVILSGGLVSQVISDEPVELIILDDNVEGLDVEDIYEVNGEEYFVNGIEADINRDAINIINSQLTE